MNDTGYNGVTPKAVQMTWQEVWERMSIYYLSDNIIYDAYGSSTLRNQWRPASVSNPKVNTYVNDDKDGQTLSLCARRRPRTFVSTPSPSRRPPVASNCCRNAQSSDASHYEVEGLDIEDAFSGIVQSINKLRLTH